MTRTHPAPPATATSAAATSTAPASAATTSPDRADITCPLPDCPTPGPVGAIHATPDGAPGRDWDATTVHDDEPARCEGAYRAAQHVLATHIRAAHTPEQATSMAVWVRIAEHAQAAKRTALGLPPITEPVVGECSWCLERVTRQNYTGKWVNAWGDDICPGTVAICDNLCQPTHNHGAKPNTMCPYCDGHGEVFGPHEPIVGPMARYQR